MCGIAGFLDRSLQSSPIQLEETVLRMAFAIQHRGPDDAGAWVDAACGIALGHRRLSILDLSAEGHQPMTSASGRFVLVFNGEVYNFAETRTELEAHGHTFRGHSDTEVMLAAFEQWGIEEATRRFNGMFAFALWDQRERRLVLGRDRFGKKPLYYGWLGRRLVFASELKALRVHEQFHGAIDRNVLALYLRFGYVPAPYSIYEGIFKLPAGMLLTIKADDIGSNGKPRAYWSAAEAIQSSVANPLNDERAALEQLDSLLRDAVRLRMVSDVPLGAFLSGGIDSSLIVSLMQSMSTQPVRTFTIGFHEKSFNEAHVAAEAARHLGTTHTELYVTPQDALDVVPMLPEMYDEPFSDSSQIPTYLLSKLARTQVTVGLSGDGGDEFFGGYDTYGKLENFHRKWAKWPAPLRAVAAQTMSSIPAAQWNRLFSLMPGGRYQNAGARLQRLGGTLSQRGSDLAYQSLISQWESPLTLVRGSRDLPSPFRVGGAPAARTKTEEMMYIDTMVYMPDDVLVKVDRASMAVSLEVRCPLLDYRLFEFAWRLPLSMKVRGGAGKWILRELLYKQVPRQIVDRPKRGFGVPIGQWLRGPLKSWSADLLSESRLAREGYLESAPIAETWREHQAGYDWYNRLWTILMFEAWLDESRRPVANPTVTPGLHV